MGAGTIKLSAWVVTMAMFGQFACCLQGGKVSTSSLAHAAAHSCCTSGHSRNHGDKSKAPETPFKSCPAFDGSTVAIHQVNHLDLSPDLIAPVFNLDATPSSPSMLATAIWMDREVGPIPPLVDLFHQSCLLSL